MYSYWEKHIFTLDDLWPLFWPLNGKISLGNTPSHIQHIKIHQKMYVNCFSPKMPHAAKIATFLKICTRLKISHTVLANSKNIQNVRCNHNFIDRWLVLCSANYLTAIFRNTSSNLLFYVKFCECKVTKDSTCTFLYKPIQFPVPTHNNGLGLYILNDLKKILSKPTQITINHPYYQNKYKLRLLSTLCTSTGSWTIQSLLIKPSNQLKPIIVVTIQSFIQVNAHCSICYIKI